jgi:hypothetical protein
MTALEAERLVIVARKLRFFAGGRHELRAGEWRVWFERVPGAVVWFSDFTSAQGFLLSHHE